ncbi:hypothetical protein OTU49_002358, partial [Cherax quadricarinatus]
DHNDEIRQEQMREMQVLNGRSGVPGGGEAGDGHTDSSGSLSPPNSLSPPPPASVKLPTAAAAHQMAAHAAATPVPPTLLTHPAMRGLTRAQMGLLSTVPSMPAPAVPGAMLGRFPTLLPFGTVAPLAPHAARSMPLYEDFTDMSSLQAEYEATMVNDSEKKDGALKAGVARPRFRHEPYRRLAVNVPS